MRSLGRGIIRRITPVWRVPRRTVRGAGSAALSVRGAVGHAIDDCGASADQEGIAGDLPEAEFLLTAAPIV
jgi:hypothetical protein